MRNFITIFLIFLVHCLFSQINFGFNEKLISPKTKQIIKAFENAKRVEGERLGAAASPSELYPNFEKLKKFATIEELIELTKHPNPITRYYAFDALLSRTNQNDILFEIVKTHLKDNVKVKTLFGCIGGRIMIGDYMLNSLQYSDSIKLNINQLNIIDSLLFWNDQSSIEERDLVFSKVKMTPINYRRLKEILTKEKNPECLIPLLWYGIVEDQEYIKEFISISPFHAFKAIKLYPKTQFVAELKKFQNKNPDSYSNETWIALYNSALAYPNDIALEIFLNPFKTENDSKIKERHAGFIYWSIKDNHSNFLYPIHVEIAGYLNNMSVEYFTTLWQVDSIKTFEFINNKFQTEAHPYWNDKLINLIIDKVETLRGDSAINFINQGINKGYSITYFTLALRAKKYNNPQTANILIKRFNEEEGLYEQDIFYRSQGILNYDNNVVYAGIEQKVFDIMEKKELTNFASRNIITLGLKSNFSRCIDTLLRYINENKRNVDFLEASVMELIEMKRMDINDKLGTIYKSKNSEYKNSSFGESFGRILKINGLI